MLNFVKMNIAKLKSKPLNSKGAKIFKKILEDKQAIHNHLVKGGKLTDIKDNYNFDTPLSIKGN